MDENKKEIAIDENKKEIAMDKLFSNETNKKLFKNKILKANTKQDVRTFEITQKLVERKEANPKTLADEANAEKVGVEKILNESDKALSELLQLGDELVTNIKAANDKREVLRRNYEAVEREELLSDLQKESDEAMVKLEALTTKWHEMETLKEPMGFYEELEIQKKRISDLMKQKDDIIEKCQKEIERADRRYNMDLDKQSSDIYTLVDRIDSQIEVIKNAYKEHIELLQETIEGERKSLAFVHTTKWRELYDIQEKNEELRIEKEKEKSRFYEQEIERMSLEHDELTRATRIRLEKDAEKLQLELSNVKNNVTLNTGKLDFNYQILQKRDVENVIIRNQRKYRLDKLNEAITNLQNKIDENKFNAEMEITKLTKHVVHLTTSIQKLKLKGENFAIMNDKKYRTVWNVNYTEAVNLINQILDVDRILHEQQLGIDWIKPDFQFNKLYDNLSHKTATKHSDSKSRLTDLKTLTKSEPSSDHDTRTDEQKLSDSKLLRSILRKISDKAGFLIEEKLVEILKPYTKEQKSLVRIDNIFDALGIDNIDDVNALIQYFVPYTWCPNCSTGLSQSVIDRLQHSEFGQIHYDASSNLYDESSKETTVKEIGTSSKIQESESDSTKCFIPFNDVDPQINKMLKGIEEKETITDHKKSVQFEKTVTGGEVIQQCENHYLVIEPAFVLTALREFAEKHLCRSSNLVNCHSKIGSLDRTRKIKNFVSRLISKTDVELFWGQLRNVFPEQKQKLWKGLEHGLKHYYGVLKERETLDSECEFLRKQNAELKHLLQQYLPQNK